MWLRQLKGLKEDNFLFGPALIVFQKLHLRKEMKTEREVLFSGTFIKRQVKVLSIN